MYQSLELFQTATQMARHAGARQALTAQNVANSETPGYVAKHMAAFRDVYTESASMQMQQTRPGHLGATGAQLAQHVSLTTSEPSPNGNAVSIEEEMFNSVAIGREHNRALTIYRHSMTILRTTLGR